MDQIQTSTNAPANFNYVPLEGTWNRVGDNFKFTGGEYDRSVEAVEQDDRQMGVPDHTESKYVEGGTALFSHKFLEGRIALDVEFDAVDHRSIGAIIIQFDPQSQEMLTFEVCGGGIRPEPGRVGFLFRLRSFSTHTEQLGQQQSITANASKRWTSLFEIGFGRNLAAGTTYHLEVAVAGSAITLYVDEVEIGRHVLQQPSLPGHACGLFCLSHSNVHFRNIAIKSSKPRAFVVMQFGTAEYESLFADVIAPMCASFGLEAYRADFTYMPGLIIDDIKKQIRESRLVIAEITPQNPNVYFEVGFADALNKPIILISDRKEGMKPFDVRAYRTIFYDNSIGGKRKIESDLTSYLQSIIG